MVECWYAGDNACLRVYHRTTTMIVVIIVIWFVQVLRSSLTEICRSRAGKHALVRRSLLPPPRHPGVLYRPRTRTRARSKGRQIINEIRPTSLRPTRPANFRNRSRSWLPRSHSEGWGGNVENHNSHTTIPARRSPTFFSTRPVSVTAIIIVSYRHLLLQNPPPPQLSLPIRLSHQPRLRARGW